MYCWRSCKGCATHTAGMSCMQSIESVSRKRREGGGEVGKALLGREPVLEVGSSTTTSSTTSTNTTAATS